MTMITRKSPITGKPVTMYIPADKDRIDAWLNADPVTRPNVQAEFPELSDDHREFLLTGIFPEEWDELFPEEDDDEPFDDEPAF